MPKHRAASLSSHPQRKHSANGPGAEASQLQYLQARLSAAEADAEGARLELLRACQQAEAAAVDVARCKDLEQRSQVSRIYFTLILKMCKALCIAFFSCGL